MRIIHVIATLAVPGFHNWPGAPTHRAYLRDRHRHLFHIKVAVPVAHEERAIEIHDLRKQVIIHLQERYRYTRDGAEFGASSCESIARNLAENLAEGAEVEVLEDGEAGARVVYLGPGV